jgi:hypothetical protein
VVPTFVKYKFLVAAIAMFPSAESVDVKMALVLTVAEVTFVTTLANAVDTCVPADKEAVETLAEETLVFTRARSVETCVAAKTDAVETVALETLLIAVRLSADIAPVSREAVDTCVTAYSDALLTVWVEILLDTNIVLVETFLASNVIEEIVVARRVPVLTVPDEMLVFTRANAVETCVLA